MSIGRDNFIKQFLIVMEDKLKKELVNSDDELELTASAYSIFNKGSGHIYAAWQRHRKKEIANEMA